MKNNEKALAAFMKALSESKAKLEALTEYAGNHMNYDPEEINWGHAGSAQHLNSLLNDIMISFGLAEEN